MTGLADPATPLSCGTCGESAGDIEPLHDGGDMPPDRGGTHPSAAADHIITQAFGHQLQNRMLGW